jgi:hypothetical protein
VSPVPKPLDSLNIFYQMASFRYAKQVTILAPQASQIRLMILAVGLEIKTHPHIRGLVMETSHQVCWYNRALSAAEVLQNYNATKKRSDYEL